MTRYSFPSHLCTAQLLGRADLQRKLRGGSVPLAGRGCTATRRTWRKLREARNQTAAMSYLDEVPFRTARSLDGDSGGENALMTAPAIDLPDCADILMSTMHDFSLERKVLYWVEVASQQQTSQHRVTSEVVPTAPPCWLLLVDPTDSYGGRARDGAVRRCISLSAADGSYGHAKGRGALSDTESETWHSEEDEYSEDDEYSSTSWEENDKDERVSRRRNAGRGVAPRPSFYQTRPKTSPGLLEPSPENGSHNPASSDPSKQRRSMVIFNNMKNELEVARRKLAALVHPLNRAVEESRGVPVPRPLPQRPCTSRGVKYGPAPDMSQLGTLVPAPPAVAAPIPPIKRHKPTVPSLSPYACLPPASTPASTPARPLSSHRSQPDSAADLLSALSQEERDLIEPVIALGYPTRKAILTLQKTGRQSLSQFLSYLGACDRLLKQGYEEGQVEEAMEMFQYSEKKAAEFLHLLAQFNDMGFQQNEIKEVLLLCGNQREKALEELVMKAQ
ncbi:ubiquitin-associated protein 1-like isoform X3 [Calonectris borealis]|uniref:ubiquitin-associated protein 1-like isoform X3 n=1 Tax=Calonectris borealis TaxID=1323832 RepID=UPI003F4B2224